jgi:hypothetical protein
MDLSYRVKKLTKELIVRDTVIRNLMAEIERLKYPAEAKKSTEYNFEARLKHELLYLCNFDTLQLAPSNPFSITRVINEFELAHDDITVTISGNTIQPDLYSLSVAWRGADVIKIEVDSWFTNIIDVLSARCYRYREGTNGVYHLDSRYYQLDGAEWVYHDGPFEGHNMQINFPNISAKLDIHGVFAIKVTDNMIIEFDRGVRIALKYEGNKYARIRYYDGVLSL